MSITLPSACIEEVRALDHDVLSHVYFDKEQSRLIATDGFSLVVIPIAVSGDKDISGVIPVQAIEIARKLRGILHLISTKVKVNSSKGSFSCKRPKADFPLESINRIVTESLELGRSCIVSLDPQKLFQLAKGLLDESYYGSYAVTLRISGNRDPIIVEPYSSSSAVSCDGRFGIIMPMEPQGETDDH